MTDHSWPWPAGAATGIGSLPGTDVAEAHRIVLGELGDFPHLVELPDRGPGADLVGRGAGLLVDLPVELYAGAWRVAGHRGRDARRTADLLARDLDQLTEQADGYTGALKVQAAGPWTLAANLDLPVGGRLLRDPGAVRDLTASLAEGLRAHVAAVAARVPGARVVLQLDEPSLPTVIAGRVPTESGFSVYRVVPGADAADALRVVVQAVGVPVVVHCCAPDVPLDVVRDAGAAGVALDLALVQRLDPLGEALDAGLGLFAGAAPTRPPAPQQGPVDGGPTDAGPTARGREARSRQVREREAGGPSAGGPSAGGPAADGRAAAGPTAAAVADRVARLWHQLGFPADRLPAQVVVTPACGLAGAPAEYARTTLAACREAARRLADG